MKPVGHTRAICSPVRLPRGQGVAPGGKSDDSIVVVSPLGSVDVSVDSPGRLVVVPALSVLCDSDSVVLCSWPSVVVPGPSLPLSVVLSVSVVVVVVRFSELVVDGVSSVPSVDDSPEVSVVTSEVVPSPLVVGSSEPDVVGSSDPDVVGSSGPDVVASSEPDVVASSEPDVVASSEPDVVEPCPDSVVGSVSSLEPAELLPSGVGDVVEGLWLDSVELLG